MSKNALSPRVYVASLSDYNNGRLHGAWVDLDGKDENDLMQEIADILAKSAYPNVMRQKCTCHDCGEKFTHTIYHDKPATCPECLETGEAIECGEPFPSAEEWAFHDFEGFGAYRLGEYESIETVIKLATAIVDFGENGEAFTAFASERGEGYLDDAIENFEEAFRGEWGSERDFAENLLDDLGELDKIPENLRYYFDYEAYTRDLFINDYSSERLSNGNVAVFDRYI